MDQATLRTTPYLAISIRLVFHLPIVHYNRFVVTPRLGVGSLAPTDVLLQNIYLGRQPRDLRLYLGNILVQSTRVSIQSLLKSIVLEIAN